MSLWRYLLFNLWYYRRPPWDSGITPPELVEFIATHPAGRALDLGCGTGTNSITLARAGWQVIGVDFAFHAIQQARQKAQQAALSVDLRVGDVTRLENISGRFDLALDIGCFHGLTPRLQESYLQTLTPRLVAGGHWLVYAMRKNPLALTAHGLTEAQIDGLAQIFRLTRREDGRDPRGRQSCWLWFERR
ncbi:MAG: SAM-dependent methyltransferase [Anaerolineae bacterium CG_4_9_14_3_um_filter_57_17]|nr:methyltransferase domain-containing protein [bacterium]NCT19999.1 methyltransferase domain-containing protein [bacterium]OIO87194.1 MAG: hypothetical protein AUK01_01040 [Anaerolineae bacterium CG2_30_57_67]PJB67115.1 MAG: SAM-dependent methyltransferase [Anaerolineae bacterium CG_4_9_14_3_um_filter_57_17]